MEMFSGKKGVNKNKQILLYSDIKFYPQFLNSPMIAYVASMLGSVHKIYFYRMYEGRYPTLVVNDAEMIKQITVKEFNNFTNHRVSDFIFLRLVQVQHFNTLFLNLYHFLAEKFTYFYLNLILLIILQLKFKRPCFFNSDYSSPWNI